MDDGSALDLFRDKHREFLNSIDKAWASLDKSRDRLRIRLRTNERLPPNWLKQLSIIVRHDTFHIEETLDRLEWPDTEGSLLVATCKRPRVVLPDDQLRAMSEVILPIGDIILFAGDGAYEHPLYNEQSEHVMSRLIVDLPHESEILS
ncbi:hypothetical protein K8R04_00250 [Candidatus Uhrbacteria bacterium]|nr:hypothetical protein [Candidatus Uhrbacteria bacterium]